MKSEKNKKINTGVAINQKGIIFARSNHKFNAFASGSGGTRANEIMAR